MTEHEGLTSMDNHGRYRSAASMAQLTERLGRYEAQGLSPEEVSTVVTMALNPNIPTEGIEDYVREHFGK